MPASKKKRTEARGCSILFYEGWVSVAPTIINISKCLADSGYEVTIFGVENPFSRIEKIGDGIKVVYFRNLASAPMALRLLSLLKRLKIDLYKVAELASFCCQLIAYRMRNRVLSSLRKDICIGVDIYGSVAARLMSFFSGWRYIYLSLELVHPDKFGNCNGIINVWGRSAYKHSECVLIQDEDRLKTLSGYNRYRHAEVFYLPNSASSSDPVRDKGESNYFREIFGLSEAASPHIILQAGIIGIPSFSAELAASFASLENGYALVYHDRIRHEKDNPYIKKLREINSKNLFLSLDPLPFEQLDKVYSAATIGLAFYRNLDDNFGQIVKASGRLSFYLKHGKPVLVNNLDSLRGLIDKYQCGIVINNPSDPAEIESALKTILGDYARFSENARICFAEEFDFAKQVKPVLSFIDSLSCGQKCGPQAV